MEAMSTWLQRGGLRERYVGRREKEGREGGKEGRKEGRRGGRRGGKGKSILKVSEHTREMNYSMYSCHGG